MMEYNTSLWGWLHSFFKDRSEIHFFLQGFRLYSCYTYVVFRDDLSGINMSTFKHGPPKNVGMKY